jgi:hypothetical protein
MSIKDVPITCAQRSPKGGRLVRPPASALEAMFQRFSSDLLFPGLGASTFTGTAPSVLGKRTVVYGRSGPGKMTRQNADEPHLNDMCTALKVDPSEMLGSLAAHGSAGGRGT